MKRAALCILVAVVMISSAAAEELMVVTGGTLRMRMQPDFNAEVTARYDEGTVVTAMEESGGWYRVTAPDGTAGYMYGAYLTPAADASDIKARVISEDGGDVNLRILPRMGASIIAAVPAGTEVTILADADGWRYIMLPDGRGGYMMSRFLAAEDGGVRYVTSTNGGGVNMRTGPSQQYRSLGVLRVGTQVTLLESGEAWHRISYGGHDGFMMARYLTTQPPKTGSRTLKSIRLSDASPRVGDMLRAQTAPEDVQCLFIWSDDAGRLLGSGEAYRVTREDIGQRIFVTAIGFGGTSGAAVSKASGAVRQ